MWCDRRFVRKLFGAQIPKGKAGKTVTQEYQSFMTGFLIGCNFEAKTWGDFLDFQKEFKLKKATWQKFFQKMTEDNLWAVVEKKEDTMRVAYFKDGIRKSAWESLE